MWKGQMTEIKEVWICPECKFILDFERDHLCNKDLIKPMIPFVPKSDFDVLVTALEETITRFQIINDQSDISDSYSQRDMENLLANIGGDCEQYIHDAKSALKKVKE